MLGDDMLFGLFTANSVGLLNHFNKLTTPDYSVRELERLAEQFAQSDDSDSQQIEAFLSAGLKFLAQSTLDTELAQKRNAQATDQQLLVCLKEMAQAFMTIRQQANASSEDEVYAQSIAYLQASIGKHFKALERQQDRLYQLDKSNQQPLSSELVAAQTVVKQPK